MGSGAGRIRSSILATIFAYLVATGSVWLERRTPMMEDSFSRQGFQVLSGHTVVIGKHVRFQFLTERMVRMEYTPKEGMLEDRPTLIFAERDRYLRGERQRETGMPSVEARMEGAVLVMRAENGVTVEYKSEGGGFGPFSEANLMVRFDIGTWRPGSDPKGNLNGTTRTLDHADGEVPLELGLLSKDGWALVNDTTGPLLQSTAEVPSNRIPWVEKRVVEEGYTDWTLLAYGHDYRTALKDFTLVAGDIPLPPKFAFGVWWSRWWIYSDNDLMELVGEFKKHRVPLDILVIDMDWHLTAYEMMNAGYVDLARQPLGWTGYTWNKTLFPNPPKFLKWCHDQGLHVTLNLHPASGVQPYEEKFVPMAKAMGIDPSSKPPKHVPFDIANTSYATNWFDVILRPLEDQGIDFWWLDWQQQNRTSLGIALNPTIWLNHVFFHDMERRRKKDNRGFVFHRWGGLGNHRYQIGFSGDTWITWASLEFQVYFTATAANVGFGFWSHDIGGFMSRDKTRPELFLRWIQWGALSPVFRTHAWRVPWIERRIWKYGREYLTLMREAVYFRYSLLPFLYTEARATHETSVAMLHPMYYDYPEIEEAYSFKTQYMLGLFVMVSPIVSPMHDRTELSKKEVWIPPGRWIEWHSLQAFEGPTVVTRVCSLDEIPIYLKEGSVVPMAPVRPNTQRVDPDTLVISVFPGPSGQGGEYSLYEDDGVSKRYKESGYARTRIVSKRISESNWKVSVGPRAGEVDGLSPSRWYSLRMIGVPVPESVVVDGKPVQRRARESGTLGRSYQWSSSREISDEIWDELEGKGPPSPPSLQWYYEPERMTLTVNTDVRLCSEETVLEIGFSPAFPNDLMSVHSGVLNAARKARHAVHYVQSRKSLSGEESELWNSVKSLVEDVAAVEKLDGARDSLTVQLSSLVESLESARKTVAEASKVPLRNDLLEILPEHNDMQKCLSKVESQS